MADKLVSAHIVLGKMQNVKQLHKDEQAKKKSLEIGQFMFRISCEILTDNNVGDVFAQKIILERIYQSPIPITYSELNRRVGLKIVGMQNALTPTKWMKAQFADFRFEADKARNDFNKSLANNVKLDFA